MKTEKQLMADLLEAKKSGDKNRIVEAVIEMLRPEAKEAVALSKKDITTQDGYGSIMRTASGLGAYKHVFIEACVREGFPRDTAETLKQII